MSCGPTVSSSLKSQTNSEARVPGEPPSWALARHPSCYLQGRRSPLGLTISRVRPPLSIGGYLASSKSNYCITTPLRPSSVIPSPSVESHAILTVVATFNFGSVSQSDVGTIVRLESASGTNCLDSRTSQPTGYTPVSQLWRTATMRKRNA